MDAKHTAMPLEILNGFEIFDAAGKRVAVADCHGAAKDIVRACNAHDELVAFAKAYRLDLQARGVCESEMDAIAMELLSMADAALAAANNHIPDTTKMVGAEQQ